MAEDFYEDGAISYQESCILETIQNSLNFLGRMGLVDSQTIIQREEVDTSTYLFLKYEAEAKAQLKNLLERMTFFKPIVTFHLSHLNFLGSGPKQTRFNLNGAKL